MAFSLPQGVKITWLGHSTFLVETPTGKRLLIDPFIQSSPVCPPDKKEVGAIDLMLITHGHGDHMADAVSIAQQSGCVIACIPEIAGFLQTKGVAGDKLDMMNKGGTIRPGGFGISVTMTNAFHSGGIQDGDTMLYGGEPSGFVVTLENGFAFYHAGDTSVFSDMSLIAELYHPRLAMLPIGDRFTMGPREAAKAVSFLKGVEAVIPMHFATFPMLTGTPEAFQNELKKVGSTVEVMTLAPGETRGG